jgi:hypothetical protein
MSPVVRAKLAQERGELVPFEDQEVVFRQLVGQHGDRAPVEFRRLFGYVPVVIDGVFVAPHKDNKRRVLKHFIRQQYQIRKSGRWAKNQYKNFFGVWPVRFEDARREVMKERYNDRKRNSE